VKTHAAPRHADYLLTCGSQGRCLDHALHGSLERGRPSRPAHNFAGHPRLWIHSREEDVGDVEVYRRFFDFDFPSFPRDAFDLLRDHTFIQRAVDSCGAVVAEQASTAAAECDPGRRVVIVEAATT
jgi:hypothetical protein